jgi:hypothetical protein
MPLTVPFYYGDVEVVAATAAGWHPPLSSINYQLRTINYLTCNARVSSLLMSLPRQVITRRRD